MDTGPATSLGRARLTSSSVWGGSWGAPDPPLDLTQAGSLGAETARWLILLSWNNHDATRTAGWTPQAPPAGPSPRLIIAASSAPGSPRKPRTPEAQAVRDLIRPGRTAPEGGVAAHCPSPCFPRTCPGTRAARDAPPRAARSGSLARRTGASPSCPTALFSPQSNRIGFTPTRGHRRCHVTTRSRDEGRWQQANPETGIGGCRLLSPQALAPAAFFPCVGSEAPNDRQTRPDPASVQGTSVGRWELGLRAETGSYSSRLKIETFILAASILAVKW